MADGPIFLAGLDRTGIGLLGEILESHPDVAVSRRTNFWDFYAHRFGDLADPENLDRCVAEMMRYTRISRLAIDPDRLKAEFARGESTYAWLFRLLQDQNVHRLGKTRWGDKSQGSERHGEEILDSFPNATMVLVVRDPRDRYASRANHRSAGRGGVGSATAAWLWSSRRAEALSGRHPDRFRAVRYEDLVGRSEETIRSLCELTALDFSEEMLGVDMPAGRLHTGSVGRFRRDLSGAEVRFIERVARVEMQRWGYEPEPVRPSNGVGFRSTIIQWPAAYTGLVLWGPWSRIRARIAAKPSSRRLRDG